MLYLDKSMHSKTQSKENSLAGHLFSKQNFLFYKIQTFSLFKDHFQCLLNLTETINDDIFILNELFCHFKLKRNFMTFFSKTVLFFPDNVKDL